MSDIAIKVDHLGKMYRIGMKEEVSETLGGNIVNMLKAPFSNFRNLKKLSNFKGEEEDTIWAVKDVSFEVKHGEVLGIIGKNGAGKSTLLKLLSRITEPTSGRIEINGRVASLLEVGTGFHQDLTGRENIYLNGTVLGMRKAEIDRKFDEIVEFSGVEKFIDTPVKRYSSGMRVRLAFAVAAHLDPEILIIDEVLAVGDTEFQNKCLGKMNDVARQGRTVLFVSHNMSAVQTLCTRAIMMKNGTLYRDGGVDEIIKLYADENQHINPDELDRKGTGEVLFQNMRVLDAAGNMKNEFFIGEPVKLYFELAFREKTKQAIVGIDIHNYFDEYFAHLVNFDDEFTIMDKEVGDVVKLEVDLGQITLAPSQYYLSLWVGDAYHEFDFLEKCLTFTTLQDTRYIKRTQAYKPRAKVVVKSSWSAVN